MTRVRQLAHTGERRGRIAGVHDTVPITVAAITGGKRTGSATFRSVQPRDVVIAFRRVYDAGWAWATAATLLFFLAYVLINFYLYRPLLFLTVFAVT